MSNVSECIDLYLDDEVVSDEMFRAIIRDAAARDLVEHAADDTRAQLSAHAHALVLLNRVDDLRRDQIEALNKRVESLVGVAELIASHMEREGA